MKIHMGDNVLVRTGKYRGKVGKVLRVSTKQQKIVVEKINIRTRHIKKRPGQAGQRIQYEGPIDVSNVMIICPECKKATRIGHLILKSGEKQRICKKCSQSIEPAVISSKKTSKK